MRTSTAGASYGKPLSVCARTTPLPFTRGDEEAREVRGLVLVGGVIVGSCPSCGGRAVFREVDGGHAVGACVEVAAARCWWTR